MDRKLTEEQLKEILWECKQSLYWRLPDSMVSYYLEKIEKVLRDGTEDWARARELREDAVCHSSDVCELAPLEHIPPRRILQADSSLEDLCQEDIRQRQRHTEASRDRQAHFRTADCWKSRWHLESRRRKESSHSWRLEHMSSMQEVARKAAVSKWSISWTSNSLGLHQFRRTSLRMQMRSARRRRKRDPKKARIQLHVFG